MLIKFLCGFYGVRGIEDWVGLVCVCVGGGGIKGRGGGFVLYLIKVIKEFGV